MAPEPNDVFNAEKQREDNLNYAQTSDPGGIS